MTEPAESSEMLDANRAYAESFTQGALPAEPARRIAILTCMDARMNVEKILGLRIGDAHILRNAGGRASDDAIRSLTVSSLLLGTRRFMVIHHTRCGMASHTNDDIRSVVRDQIGGDASGVDFLPFTDLDESVREDVRRLRESPLIPREVSVEGYVYDVQSGRLTQVQGA